MGLGRLGKGNVTFDVKDRVGSRLAPFANAGLGSQAFVQARLECDSRARGAVYRIDSVNFLHYVP
jgi:hypothetical protein